MNIRTDAEIAKLPGPGFVSFTTCCQASPRAATQLLRLLALPFSFLALAACLCCPSAHGQTCGPQWLPGVAMLNAEPGNTNPSVSSLAIMPNREIVVGGSFASVGGTGANNIARWNGSAWFSLGSGPTTGGVFTLILMPNGDVVAGGTFGSIGGFPAAKIARWNGTTWAQLGTGMNNSVSALAVMPNGDLVAGGSFSNAGGIPSSRIALWNGTTWSSLGSGMNGSVSALAVMPNGDLIAGGLFTTAGGVAARSIARWNGSSWGTLGTGLSSLPNQIVRALAVLPSGSLVAGGQFSAAGGVAANSIALWNGTSWSPLGSGVMFDTSLGTVSCLTVLPSGDVIAGGLFSTAGGVPAKGIAQWNGSSWAAWGTGLSNVNTANAFSARAVVAVADDDRIVGGDFTNAGGFTSRALARYSSGAPTISAQPTPQTLDPGQALLLSASAGDGYGSVAVQWLHDGSPITDGPGGASAGGGFVSGAHSTLASPTHASAAVLTIGNTQPSDSGLYSALFSNACGTVASVPVSFNVSSPCRTDYNVDGSVNPDDIGDYVTDYFASPPIPGPGGYAILCQGNPAPFDAGYKAAYTSDGLGQCGEPNPDNLGDWITDYFMGC